MSMRTRIVWNISVYVLALLAYLVLSDGQGRFEFSMKLIVLFGPLLIALDAMIAYRRSKK